MPFESGRLCGNKVPTSLFGMEMAKFTPRFPMHLWVLRCGNPMHHGLISVTELGNSSRQAKYGVEMSMKFMSYL